MRWDHRIVGVAVAALFFTVGCQGSGPTQPSVAGTTSLDVQDVGAPWPATVIHVPQGACFSAWLDSGGNFIPLTGQGIGVLQEKNGNWNFKCQIDIDFDDPGIATIPQVCGSGALPPGTCRANGSVVAKDLIACFFLDPFHSGAEDLCGDHAQRAVQLDLPFPRSRAFMSRNDPR